MANKQVIGVMAGIIVCIGAAAVYHYARVVPHKRPVVTLHHFQIKLLDSFPGGRESIALGLNNSGQVVGRAGRADSAYRAVIWKNGRPIDLGTFGGDFGEARAISDDGTIVGSASQTDGTTHAFIYSHGHIRDIGLLSGGLYSYAADINNHDEAVGFGGTLGLSHAWTYTGGHLHDLGPEPGFISSTATHITDSGSVIGGASLDTDSGSHAFINKSGRFTDLGVLPKAAGSLAFGENENGEIVGTSGSTARHSFPVIWKSGKIFKLETAHLRPYGVAQSINSSGVVVGYFIGDFETHACEWRDGAMIDLNDEISKSAGWDLLKATRINNRGDIIGKGRFNGREVGFLLSPL